jgi:hypothetical protein
VDTIADHPSLHRRRGAQGRGRGSRAVQRAALDFERRGLAVVLHQCRFGIEHVDGAGPAADVDEDDALRPGGEVRRLGPQIVGALFGRLRTSCGGCGMVRLHGVPRQGRPG